MSPNSYLLSIIYYLLSIIYYLLSLIYYLQKGVAPFLVGDGGSGSVARCDDRLIG